MKRKNNFPKVTLLQAIFILISIFMLGISSPAVTNTQNKSQKSKPEVIHNDPSKVNQSSLPVRIEFVRQIGELEATDEHFAFYLPSDVALDKKGNVYILDTGNHRIQKFNSVGDYMATIGRQGQGPGEFYFPSSLCLDTKDNLFVADPYNNRIEILNSEGREIKTIRLQDISVGKIRCLPDGKLVHNTGSQLIQLSQDENKLSPLLHLRDSAGKIILSFVTPFDFNDLLVNRQGNQCDFALTPDGEIVVSFYYQNRIEKYSPSGKIIWKADRRLNYKVGPQGKGKLDRQEGRVSVMMPKMNRCSSGIAVDSQGRIWVATLSRQLKREEEVGMMVGISIANGERTMSLKVKGNTELRKTDAYILEIYSPDGHYLGFIPVDIFIDGVFIFGDRLFLLDKMRGCSIIEYRIRSTL